MDGFWCMQIKAFYGFSINEKKVQMYLQNDKKCYSLKV